MGCPQRFYLGEIRNQIAFTPPTQGTYNIALTKTDAGGTSTVATSVADVDTPAGWTTAYKFMQTHTTPLYGHTHQDVYSYAGVTGSVSGLTSSSQVSWNTGPGSQTVNVSNLPRHSYVNVFASVYPGSLPIGTTVKIYLDGELVVTTIQDDNEDAHFTLGGSKILIGSSDHATIRVEVSEIPSTTQWYLANVGIETFLPTVSLSVDKDHVSEAGFEDVSNAPNTIHERTVKFTATRTTPFDKDALDAMTPAVRDLIFPAMSVPVKWSGEAANSNDVSTLLELITIPAGALFGDVKIVAKDDSISEWTEKLTAKITAPENTTVSFWDHERSVDIYDNDKVQVTVKPVPSDSDYRVIQLDWDKGELGGTWKVEEQDDNHPGVWSELGYGSGTFIDRFALAGVDATYRVTSIKGEFEVVSDVTHLSAVKLDSLTVGSTLIPTQTTTVTTDPSGFGDSFGSVDATWNLGKVDLDISGIVVPDNNNQEHFGLWKIVSNDNGQPVASGTLKKVPKNISIDQLSSSGYTVVAGIDMNGNGILDANEHTHRILVHVESPKVSVRLVDSHSVDHTLVTYKLDNPTLYPTVTNATVTIGNNAPVTLDAIDAQHQLYFEFDQTQLPVGKTTAISLKYLMTDAANNSGYEVRTFLATRTVNVKTEMGKKDKVLSDGNTSGANYLRRTASVYFSVTQTYESIYYSAQTTANSRLTFVKDGIFKIVKATLTDVKYHKETVGESIIDKTDGVDISDDGIVNQFDISIRLGDQNIISDIDKKWTCNIWKSGIPTINADLKGTLNITFPGNLKHGAVDVEDELNGPESRPALLQCQP